MKRGLDEWLMTVIPATQAEIRKIKVRNQPKANSLQDPNLKEPFTKIVLVEWLKF
jgi:Tfp pilus assembly protein PilP